MSDILRRSGWLAFVILISLLIVIGAIVLALSGGPAARFSASIEGVHATDTSHVTVHVSVLNTGDKAGTPRCIIDLNSPGDIDWGTETLIAEDPIPAGRQLSYSQTVAVTNNGGANITVGASSVTC